VVRSLSGKRSAILLPTSPAFLVALAASEGRGAVLINPLAAPFEIAHQLANANIGAVFTNAMLAEGLPDSIPRVLLDDAPARAQVLIDGTARDVDLGAHLGMAIEGDTGAAGSDDEAVIVYTSAMKPRTRRDFVAPESLGQSRDGRRRRASGRGSHSRRASFFLFGLNATCAAALLARNADDVAIRPSAPWSSSQTATSRRWSVFRPCFTRSWPRWSVAGPPRWAHSERAFAAAVHSRSRCRTSGAAPWASSCARATG
jgi:hypothetical protein